MERCRTMSRRYMRYQRDKTEVSCCLKYLIFSFNIIFWVVGFLVMAVGIWAWTEKDKFTNLSELTHVPLDPAFFFIIAGGITFIIAFTGCIGALRENTCLLCFYSFSLSALLLIEVAFCVLCFVFKDKFKEHVTVGFLQFIKGYRDDVDQQNLIDYIQSSWLQCCGGSGPQDWDNNRYYMCVPDKSLIRSSDACGVPPSCCIPAEGEVERNLACGQNTRAETRGAGADIYHIGCLAAGEAWAEENLLVVTIVAVAVSLLQILGICFSQSMRSDIFAQKAKWIRSRRY